MSAFLGYVIRSKLGNLNFTDDGELAARLRHEGVEVTTVISQPEPAAWRWRVSWDKDNWQWSATEPSFSPRDLELGIVFDVQPLYVLGGSHG